MRRRRAWRTDPAQTNAGGAGTAATGGTNASTSSGSADRSGSDTLAIVALILGALGLVAGAVALASVRHARGPEGAGPRAAWPGVMRQTDPECRPIG